jgi:penicillin-binding protein 1C
MLGPEALFERLQDSGLQLDHSAGFHGHALALGSAETSLLALANAYRMLANGGVHRAPGLPGPTPDSAGRPRRVFTAAATGQVARILADPAARASTFGFDSVLATRHFAAVKTGTSKDLRDNWCIGFDAAHTVAAWVGNAGGEPMHAVSGTAGAAPAWQQTMAWLQARDPSSARNFGSGPGLAPRGHARVGERVGGFGIEEPRNGSVIALDPEIPGASQRLAIAGAPARWRLHAEDGRQIRLGRGQRFSWRPLPGRWTIERLGNDGQVLDRSGFEVRLPPAPGAVARR